MDRTVLCISPHLDDAALSAGGVIWRASRAGRRVVIASVCTRAAPPEAELSPLGRQLHRAWQGGEEDPSELRRGEDGRACAVLGAEARHLGLPDAIYRRGAAGEHYRSFAELFADPLPLWDQSFVQEVRARLELLLRELRPRCVLGPLGLGGHVDHQQVARALRQLEEAWARPLFYYEDQPYAAGLYGPSAPVELRRDDLPQRCELHSSDWAIDSLRKRDAILCYGSQLTELFGADRSGLAQLERYAGSLNPARGAVERLWADPRWGEREIALALDADLAPAPGSTRG